MGELRRRLRSRSVGPQRGSAPLTREGAPLLAGAWRRTTGSGDARPDLRAVDFRGLMLDGVDLSECRLEGSSFEGASLREATFARSNLRGVSFRRAVLRGANLLAVDANEAVFDDADLEEAHASTANFARTSWRHASLERAVLTSATFFASDLRNARLTGSSRQGADYEEADTTWAECGRTTRLHSFAPLEHTFLAFLRLGWHAERALRGLEACVLRSSDVEAEVLSLFDSPHWRAQLVGAAAMALVTPSQRLMVRAWQLVEDGTWVSPQLVGALSLGGFAFPPTALISPKARGAVKALQRRPPADEAEREGHQITSHWLERLEVLTVALGR